MLPGKGVSMHSPGRTTPGLMKKQLLRVRLNLEVSLQSAILGTPRVLLSSSCLEGQRTFSIGFPVTLALSQQVCLGVYSGILLPALLFSNTDSCK